MVAQIFQRDELLIRGGHVCDPASERDEVADVAVQNGVFVDSKKLRDPHVVEASGLTVLPGLIDVHVHLREPGGEAKETIASATAAAAAGGFTTVLAMPNTTPAPDSPEHVQAIRERCERDGMVDVLICGCLTLARKGRVAVDVAALAANGVVAVSDDGGCPQDATAMDSVMTAAYEAGLPIIEHAEDSRLAGDGVMHDGDVAARLGWPEKSSESEAAMIRRDILLAEKTGVRLHVQHVSTRAGVELIRDARRRGVPVTGEVTPHHLLLTECAVAVHGVNAKMNPPLRSTDDRESLIAGLADGTLTMLATDHAPHTAAEKAQGMVQAPNGVTGLEAALGIALTELYWRRDWSLIDVVRLLTVGPAELLGICAGTLRAGEKSNFVLVDIDREWRYVNKESRSQGRNCPYDGMTFRGKVMATYVGGHRVWGACR